MGFHLARNTTHFVGQYAWALAVTLLPFATVFSLEFTTPAWVALLAALILGERMTKSRLGSVVLGFLGVLVIVRPGMASFQPTALLVLFAAFTFAISLIVTKQLTNRVSTFAIIFWMNLIQLPMALAWPSIVAATGGPSLFVFRLGADLLIPTLALGVVGLTSHYCLTQAFRSGDATVVVPLDFLRIPLIALVGWMFYGEALDGFVFAGAGLIICGVLWNLFAESRRSRFAGGGQHGEGSIRRILMKIGDKRPKFGHHSGLKVGLSGRRLGTAMKLTWCRALVPAAAVLAALLPAHAQQQPPQPPQAQPQAQQNPYCSRLEAQLQTFDRGGTDAARADQLRKLEETAASQQTEIDRQEAVAQRAGCEKNSFLVLFSGQPAQCGPLNNKIQQMRDNLDRIQSDLERQRGDAAPEREGQRRAILVALAQNNCGAQYQQQIAATPPPQRRPVRIRCSVRSRCSRRAAAASSDAPSLPSGTFRTVCVRTCDGFYYPISAATNSGPLCRRRKGLPRSPARPPRSSSIPIAIPARTSTRRCRSRPSSPTRRCRTRSAIAPRSIRPAVAGGPARAGRRR